MIKWLKNGPECAITIPEDFSTVRKVSMGQRGEVFSSRATAGRRTYFFNVKENRHGDIFLNMVESKKNGTTDFERHSIIVFKEDLENFLEGFDQAVKFIRKS
jgi:hypothetical protein